MSGAKVFYGIASCHARFKVPFSWGHLSEAWQQKLNWKNHSLFKKKQKHYYGNNIINAAEKSYTATLYCKK